MSKTIIIQSLNEARILLKEQKFLNEKIIVFSPDIRNLLEKNKFSLVLPNLNHNFENEIIIKKLISYNEKIEEYFKQNVFAIDHIEECFNNLFFLVISAIEFYKNLIFTFEKQGPWSLYKGNKLISIDNIELLQIEIINKLIYQRKGIFKERRLINYKNNLRFNFIYKLLNYLIALKVKKNNIWLTGNIYGQKNIITKLKKFHPNLNIIYFTFSNKYNFFKLLKNFLKILILKNNSYEMTLNPTVRMNYSSVVNSTLSNILGKNSVLLKTNLVNFFQEIFEYQYSFEKQFNKYFFLLKPKLLIAHQLNLFEPTILGSIFKREKKPVYLISHGAHRNSNNNLIQFELYRHARGLLFSRFASHLFLQQDSALEFMKYYPNNKLNKKIILCRSPIMWSVNQVINKNINNKSDIIFLHACTFKPQSIRIGVYENSFQYLDNIIFLANNISKFDNCKLILRLRDLEECKIDTINDSIKNLKNVSISNNISFQEDLSIADCLISYSSTAIEEAQFNGKKISIIDFNNNNHLNFNDNYNQIIKLTNENFKDKFVALIDEIKLYKRNENQEIKKNYFFKNYENSNTDIESFAKQIFNF